jgi:multicomponent Na+:H+ antiporter subunit C
MTELPLALDGWFAHAVYALLVGIGLFVLVDDENLVKKVIGLNVLQTGVFLFFITSAYRVDGRAPLVVGEGPFVNPLPHVLILTAIVVGVSVTAVALALVVRLYEEYGTLREDVIRELRAEARLEAETATGAETRSGTGTAEGRA